MFEKIMSFCTPENVKFILLTFSCISLIIIYKKWNLYIQDKITKDKLLFDYVVPLGIWVIFGIILYIFAKYYHSVQVVYPALDPQIPDNVLKRRV